MIEPKLLSDNATDSEKVMNYLEWVINNMHDQELIEELARDNNQTIQEHLLSVIEQTKEVVLSANQNQ